jgi:hypothetical protein
VSLSLIVCGPTAQSRNNRFGRAEIKIFYTVHQGGLCWGVPHNE